ncbi:MAG: hypothetical protein K6G26_12775 [Lachnospiraceae bacterium]|nr:hypothetical protein [Lachnospiraceae bacterium]
MNSMGNSMADLNGFDLNKTESSMDVNSTVRPEIFNKKETNSFQPSFNDNEFVKSGSVKISSVYDNTSSDKQSVFSQTVKDDFIPQQDIVDADNSVREYTKIVQTTTEDNIKGNNVGFGVVGDSNIAVMTKKEGESFTETYSSDEADTDEIDEKEAKRMKPLPVWRWCFSLIGLSIPVLNVLLILIWAIFKTNKSRQNMARAMILLTFIICGAAALIIYLTGAVDIVTSTVTDYINGVDTSAYMDMIK